MITTFYSYKGGVGRSMALANVADVFAHRGLKTAMIDFDLEAPGLERFFLSDPTPVRRNLGLLDLLLAYKQAMSVSPGEGDAAAFRNLAGYLVPIYRQLPSGGTLDLLPAGQRGDDEQLATYAYHLRTFDWQEFYFEWFGEVFFKWLRRELLNRYDVILIDSRTGMTEMGGVCAYQLADQVVMFCAANSQNVQGTRDIIRNFQSPRVVALRKERPLQVVVVPARVQQNSGEVERFHAEFERSFAPFTPPALADAGQTMWELMLPYEAAYAFEERLVSRDAEGFELRSAFERLAETVALLAPLESTLHAVAQRDDAKEVQTPVFDPTRPFAGYDVFVSYNRSDQEAAVKIANELASRGLKVWFDQWNIAAGEPLMAAIERGLDQSRAFVILIGPEEPGIWRKTEERLILERSLTARDDFRLIPVLLPGATFESIPDLLQNRVFVDFRPSLDDEDAFEALVKGILGGARGLASSPRRRVNPYKGLACYREEDAEFFFGRDSETASVVRLLLEQNFVAVVGPSGSGKTSLIHAAVIPRLRYEIAGLQVLLARPGARPMENLAAALENVADTDARHIEETLLSDPASAPALIRPGARVLLVIDQLEEIWQYHRSAEVRPGFVQAVRALIGPCRVVVTLRADFYGAALEEGLQDLLATGQVNLGALSRNALRTAIERPALSEGLAFEPGLVERLIEDAQESTTPLPLLQVALNEMWMIGQRDGRGFITHAAYAEAGQIGAALSQSAERVYDSLTREQQKAARFLFLRMISAEGHAVSVSLDELSADQHEILDILIQASLVVVSSDQDTAVARITHEALIRYWPRLRDWLYESREHVQLLMRIRDAALEWERFNRDRDFLYRGKMLKAAQSLLDSEYQLLSPLAREFIVASAAEMPLLARIRAYFGLDSR